LVLQEARLGVQGLVLLKVLLDDAAAEAEVDKHEGFAAPLEKSNRLVGHSLASRDAEMG
jgi:hypothetical protein